MENLSTLSVAQPLYGVTSLLNSQASYEVKMEQVPVQSYTEHMKHTQVRSCEKFVMCVVQDRHGGEVYHNYCSHRPIPGILNNKHIDAAL